MPHLSSAVVSPDAIYEDPVGMKYSFDEGNVMTQVNVSYASRPNKETSNGMYIE